MNTSLDEVSGITTTVQLDTGQPSAIEGAVDTMENAETLDQAMESLDGYDEVLLDKAEIWAYNHVGSTDTKDVLAQYAVMHELVLNDRLKEVNLHTLLNGASIANKGLSQKRIDDYSLIPLRSTASEGGGGCAVGWYGTVEPGLEYAIYLDAPTGFALTYRGYPQAVVALAATQQNGLMIHQLQGVRGVYVDLDGYDLPSGKIAIGYKHSRGLATIDWQKFMVDVTTEFGRIMGMDQIAIQAGKHNHWADPLEHDAPHLTKAAAEKAYDVPAKRLGFRRCPDGNWYKDIS